MFEFLFVILFFLFPVLALYVYKYIFKESILKVGILNFLLISIFVFAYIGIIFLFFHMDPLRVSNGVIDRETIFLVWFFSSLSIFFIMLGGGVAKKTLSLADSHFSIERIKKINNIQRLKSYIFIVIGIVFLYLYIKAVPEIAIFNIFSFESKSGIQSLRSDMGNNFEGSYFLYSIFMEDILKFLLFSFYAQWLVFHNKKDLYVVLFLFVVNGFIALMATEKAPLIWLIVGMFLVNTIICRKGLIPIKSIFKISIPIFSILICMYMFFMKSLSVSDAFNSVLSRTFTGSITPAYFYLELFPEHYDFLYGKSFPNPKGIFPYEPVRLTVLVMNWVNPQLEQLGIVGTMPTVYWAEIYANFGPIFIAPFSFFIGFVLRILDSIILKFRELPIGAGYYVWVILYFRSLSVTSFSNFILNITLIIITLVFVFISMKKLKLSYVR
ncbi:hypothetical protein CDG60_01095 [Acinetobacter chinensis]|uniref:Oligosaccharide repeat unit polymerase n=1 Tax=Acinetobacter chinensis TaxID=2004650 RepID=A0A3B7LYC7_9GAMM|nr:MULTISPECIES: O-antigen polymerase [Acinetobacter]AXY55323.1 hypothetical protein CDG60_01095 [Acinetobacter chinensis]AXY61543.1 hypothetical protein CDG61_16970 [Acinetobacter sp. WCHAc010052]